MKLEIKEIDKMKKLMFLTMMLGLMIAFTGSVSAQKVLTSYTGKVGPGKTVVIAPGDQIRFNVHVQGSDNKNNKAGTRYMLISFARKNGTKTETIGALLDLPQNVQDGFKANNMTLLNQGTIKSIDKPVEIRLGDVLKVIFYENGGNMVDIENTRNGKLLGKMRVRW